VTDVKPQQPSDEGDRIAPGRLELVRQFVNTRDLWKQIDWIDSPDRLAAWLVEYGRMAEPPSLTAKDIARTQAFREALRALLFAHTGRPTPPEALDSFNETALSLSLIANATQGRIELVSTDEGLNFMLGSIVAAVVGAQLEGTWPRLKACANERCRTGMYDRTRNRTRIWCNASTCGAQVRSKAYRQRKAQELENRL
jgi:predicted RNA-binding Zn ribbon-like protein